MDTHKNDSENSEKSEPGSNIIISLKPPLNSDGALSSNDDTKRSTDSLFIHPVRHQDQICNLALPSQPPPFYRQRFPPRTYSSPNLTNKTKKHYNFQSGLRPRISQPRSLPVLDMKHVCDKADNSLPNSALLHTTTAEPGMSAKPVQPFTDSEPHQTIRGGRVLGLISRLTSLISSRTLNPIDEGVLNNLKMEVGNVASRVEMWTQRLEEEMTNSVRSHTRSFDAASTRRSTPDSQTQAFITGEIWHLVQLTRNLATSLSGGFTSWGWFGIEDKLMLLLKMGSNMVFPTAETLMIKIWWILREILDLHGDDTEKSGAITIVEAINDAFYAIRSLIHLGKAYQSAHEPSDSDYTGDDSRSILARSLLNLDQKP